jgi:hypothetical protein
LVNNNKDTNNKDTNNKDSNNNNDSNNDSQMSNADKGRRWGRKSRRDLDASIQEAETAINYVPPSLSESVDNNIVNNNGSNNGNGNNNGSNNNNASNNNGAPSTTSSEYFVTSPPKKVGLTGNISSLFRRAASREPGDGRRSTRSRSRGRNNSNNSNHDKVNYYQEDEEVDDGVLAALRHHRTQQSQQSQHQQSHQIQKIQQSQHNSQEPSSPRSAVTSAASSTMESPMARAAKAAAGGGGVAPGNNRLFYSAQNDDDSQDSFESKASRFSKASFSISKGGDTRSGDADGDADGDGDDSETQATDDQDTNTNSSKTKTILRFRGFSTSLKSLFLDEALVCASMGCFGLILSNRTEYLLQIRNDRRGVRWGRSTSRRALPSRIVAYALFLTFVLIAMTFVIWGFGTNSSNSNSNSNGFYDNYDYTDDGNQNQGNDAYNGNYNNNNGNNNGNYNNNDDDGNANYNNNNNDDDGNANYNNNNDDGNANYNNDDANANYNNDDGNANYNNNDDANANYNNNDDANANYNNDDANANYNNDDANANGDDGNNNDDGNANYNNDDGNANGDDAYYDRRMVGKKDATVTATTIITQCPHRTNGIFKIRDMNEALWIPATHFLNQEWHSQDDRRNLKDYGSSSSSSSSFSTTTPTATTTQQRDLGVGSVSSSTKQAQERDLPADLRLAFILVFLVVLGILGRRRRMRTRYYLIRARAQEDHLFYASSGVGVKRVAFQDTREDQYEGACSHTLCGCYPTDPPKGGDEIDDAVEVSDDGVTQRKKKRHHEDCVSRGFDCLVQSCCGAICKCWFQCLSICALAQEAREIRLLLPTRFQRIDFITHQPFYEYQKHLNDLRRGWLGKTRGKSGIMPHFNALSRLSRYIVCGFLSTFVVILATLLLNPRASFSWPDAVVLIATFLQSFFVIYFVHWLFHKSDLSIDAVIKFFAAGFLIAVPSAFFFEGLMVNITLTTAWTGYSICEAICGEIFVNWVGNHYRLIWILGELVNAYVVAAVTEELCKYYTFRCVEHPDLIFLTGLDRKSQDDRDIEGGLVKYPFGSHQVQQSNKDFGDDVSIGNMSRASHRSVNKNKKEEDTLHPSTTDDEFYEDEHDVRTHLQKAAAVTTGMICVAVGLACAENFIYVFLLGGASSNGSPGGVMEEWIVLLFRSIFPVHALAAAMQSVNMIRKFVECDDDNSHRVGVGRIILPAVIMHGSFDAVLLGINVFIETSWDTYLEANGGNIDKNNPPYNPIIVNIVAWVSIIFVMLSGLFWYYRENRNQRLRLILLEQKEKAMETGSAPYTSPSELGSPRQTASELELV